MLTVFWNLSNVLTSVAGLSRATKTISSFPADGLKDLFLFTDGAGTNVANSVAGRPAATIQHPTAVNNAFSWLTGGGGLRLEGTEVVVGPTIDASLPWTLVSIGAIVGSVGGTASERITGILGFSQMWSAQLRGALLFARGGNDWNSGTPDIFYQQRAASGGALGASASLSPSTGLFPVGKRRVRTFSYNGVDTITATSYDKDATLTASAPLATSDAAMLTISGSGTLNNLNPSAGLSSSTYAGGAQEIEAFAVYDHVLDASEVALLAKAGVALGVARSRIWA